MTTKPWPESNPHPEKGPLWVQWDVPTTVTPDDCPHCLRREGTALGTRLTDAEAITIARQLGQECPPPPTKKVLWKHAIGERLPDGRGIEGARGGKRPCVAVLDFRTDSGLMWLDESAPADDDGMVEVLA